MLAAAIITGLVSGFAGFLGSAINDDKAANKLQKEMDFIDEMYQLNKKEADKEFYHAKEEAEKNAALQMKQADLTDLGQDITEKGLSNDFNTAIDNLYLSQAQDAMSWNNTSMQMASQQGAAYSQLAASGVRAGSSLSDAVLMDSATNSAQLQFAQDAKRRSDNNNLASVLNGLAGNQYGIMQNRIGADIQRSQANDLINSYGYNGYNYNLYQNQQDKLLTQRNYQYNAAKNEKKEHEGWNKVVNALGGFFGMGTKGFSTGYNVAETWKDAAKYKPDYKIEP